jgi:hypothetical protein
LKKTAVAFLTDQFDTTWPKEAEDPPSWGQDCAAFFVRHLPRYGVQVPTPDPEEQEGGWYLRLVAASGRELMFFVRLWPVGIDPERQFWVIQVLPWPSLIPSFLRRRASEEDYRAVCEAIDKVVVKEIEAKEVRWLAPQELSSL